MQFATLAEVVGDLSTDDTSRVHLARAELRKRYSNAIGRLTDTAGRPSDSTRGRDRCVENVLRSLEMYVKRARAYAFGNCTWEEFDSWVLLYCDRLLSVLKLPAAQPVGFAGNSGCFGGSHSAGRTNHGEFVISWLEQPREAVGGDWWQYEPLGCGSLLVIVADVTDHGLLSYLLREGLPHLWRMCLDETASDIVDPGTLAVSLDRELASVLPEGYYVDATVVRFDVDPESAAVICREVPPLEFGAGGGTYRGLISGGTWLGIGVDNLRHIRRAFPVDSELVIATDGLADQPVGPGDVAGRLLGLLQVDFETCESPQSMHHAVVERLRTAIRQAGAQHDDVCIVTVTAKGTSGEQPSTEGGE